MCGISVTVIHHHTKNCSCNTSFENQNHLDLLKNRGPDGFQSHSIEFNNFQIIASGSVLHQRGQPNNITLQPAISTENNFLLWNGEVFNEENVGIKETENDTSFLLRKFSEHTRADKFLDILGQINGPWALIFWHNETQKLYFGRDIFGRRSLLQTTDMHISENKCYSWSLSSVATNESKWEEVSALGLYCINFKDAFIDFTELECILWSSTPSGDENIEKTNSKLIPPIKNLLCSEIPPPRNKTQPINEYVMQLYGLTDSVINNQIQKSLTIKPEKQNKLYSEILEFLVNTNNFSYLTEQFITILSHSVEKRVKNQPMLCRNCVFKPFAECTHSSLAVLFSGGIDSMIIAYLANKYVPSNLPIDLLNVSFEHALKSQTNIKSKKTEQLLVEKTFMSPDRLTGKQGYDELCCVCPLRTWKFVEIDITIAELQEKREERIKYLIKPSNTVLDDSIGCALWFASKGDGFTFNAKGEKVNYSSPARVVLAGMGADEQLSGYSRHRQKYLTGGWKNLLMEIKVEIDRISNRNLGRDDRIISDHGREARFPFLDESVVSFLNHLPLHLKVNLELPRGLGDKLLLRMCAHSLKLMKASILAKRAIQFGSRIAFSEGKEKGSDACNRLNIK